MSRNDSWHQKISTGRHFQNGHHNTANQPLTTGLKNKLKATLNLCGIVSANLKIETSRNFSMSGINSGRWNQTMWNLCGIVVAILKMATAVNSHSNYIQSYQFTSIWQSHFILFFYYFQVVLNTWLYQVSYQRTIAKWLPC
jgi:hypothetical protein